MENKRKNSTVLSPVYDFYSVNSFTGLLKSIWYDFLNTIFLNSGSGLLLSVAKGVVGHTFIKSKLPLYIGKRTKFVNTYNIELGKNVHIKDDVTIIAHGKVSIGDNVIIGEKTTILAKTNLTIGNNTTITRNCYIAQLGGAVIIEDNVLIGDYTRIHSINHTYADKRKPIWQQDHTRTTIHIEKNVWVGSGVMIINNTRIGEGSVIGANAVVNKSIPNFVVAAGVPAKVIRNIHNENKK